MDEAYQNDRERLAEIAAKIETFLDGFQKEHSVDGATATDAPQSWLSVMAKTGVEKIFNTHASPQSRESFKEICRDIHKLPDEYSKVIADSLWSIGTGSGMLKRWATRGGPMAFMMPHALKALNTGISFILNESAEDREFRRFYALAEEFSYAASKAQAGTLWDKVNVPQEPVQEYNDEALALRDKICEQFAKLNDRFITMMNYRLRQFKPVLFAPDLAPLGHINTPSEEQRIVDFNEKNIAKARPYQTGETTIRDVIDRLDTGDFSEMSDLAHMIVHATEHGYYGELLPLATAELNRKSGEITNIRIPKPDNPTVQ